VIAGEVDTRTRTIVDAQPGGDGAALRMPTVLVERLADTEASPFARAAQKLSAGDEVDELRFALVTLTNRVLAADRVAPGDDEAVAAVLERLVATLDLAIERLAQGDDARGAAALWSELAPLRTKAMSEGRPAAIELLLVEARFATANGDAHGALAAVETAARLIESPADTPDPMACAVALAHGAALLAADAPPADTAAAATRALAAARALSLDPARSSLVGQALLLESRALARAGRVDEARRDAAEAARQLSQTLGASHRSALAALRLAGIA